MRPCQIILSTLSCCLHLIEQAQNYLRSLQNTFQKRAKASGNDGEIEQKMLRAIPNSSLLHVHSPSLDSLSAACLHLTTTFKDLPTPPCPISFAQCKIELVRLRQDRVKCRFWDADCRVYVFSRLVTAFSGDYPWRLQDAAQRIFLQTNSRKDDFLARFSPTAHLWVMNIGILCHLKFRVGALWALN